jgi:ketosteroid isomerase-like protein
MITTSIEAEKKAIYDLFKKASEFESQKDLDALMELGYFDETVIAHAPNMPPIKGLEAMRNFYSDFFKILDSIEGDLIDINISESGDMAYAYGWFKMGFKSPDGPIEDEGKNLLVFRQINSKWKCVAGSFSTNKPAT